MAALYLRKKHLILQAFPQKSKVNFLSANVGQKLGLYNKPKQSVKTTQETSTLSNVRNNQ